MVSSIWTEKYRPTSFEEVRGQKDIIEKVKAFVKSGNMPHLLFSGPAGVGKTTLALVIAKELFGGLTSISRTSLGITVKGGIYFFAPTNQFTVSEGNYFDDAMRLAQAYEKGVKGPVTLKKDYAD